MLSCGLFRHPLSPPNIAPGMWQVLCPCSGCPPPIPPNPFSDGPPHSLSLLEPQVPWDRLQSSSALLRRQRCSSVPSQDGSSAPPKVPPPPLCYKLLVLPPPQLGCQACVSLLQGAHYRGEGTALLHLTSVGGDGGSQSTAGALFKETSTQILS